MQHIGNEFKRTIILSLLPGVKVSPYSFFQVQIRYLSRDHYNFNYHTTSYYINGQAIDDLQILVGSDVYEIDYLITEHNKAKMSAFRTSLRIDRLILLNLAAKLLKKPVSL